MGSSVLCVNGGNKKKTVFFPPSNISFPPLNSTGSLAPMNDNLLKQNLVVVDGKGEGNSTASMITNEL